MNKAAGVERDRWEKIPTVQKVNRIVILLASCLGFRLNHSYIKSVGFRGLSVPTPLRSATRPVTPAYGV